MSRSTIIILAVVVGIIVSLGFAVDHYRGNAITYKEQRDKATEKLNLANTTITDIRTRQRDVETLDAKYTGELADAKDKLDDLQRCISDGKCGLRINAKCPASGTTTTSSMGDASATRLDNAAERDYFTLRERIATVTKQVSYLQEYINTQCLK